LNTFYKENKETFEKLETYIDGLDTLKGSLIDVLHYAQEIFGYLPEEVQVFVAKKLGLSASHVYGVVTFYTFFNTKPKGQNKINVCMGTACFVRGSSEILEEFKKQLEIDVGETTPDGRFSLDSVRCIGACSKAPVVTVNGEEFGNLKKSDVKNIIDKCLEG